VPPQVALPGRVTPLPHGLEQDDAGCD
jgi:hypothetical protein